MAFVPNTLSNLPVTSGRIIFVSSTGNSDTGGRASDANAGRDPNVPMATLDAAVARCRADKGDIIVLMPGHAEPTVTTSIALDVDGIWVYGLGWGDSRPTFTMTGTSGNILLSGNSVRLSNVVCVPGVASCVSAITVTGDDCIVEECETILAAASEFLSLVDVGAANAVCVRNIIRNNTLRTLNGVGATNGIQLTGCDDILIEGNLVTGHFTEHTIDNTSATSVDEILLGTIKDNILRNTSDTGLVIEMDTNATGILVRNVYLTALDHEAGWSADAMLNVENYLADTVDESGAIMPTLVSTS